MLVWLEIFFHIVSVLNKIENEQRTLSRTILRFHEFVCVCSTNTLVQMVESANELIHYKEKYHVTSTAY